MNPLTETRIETYVPLYRKYRPQVFANVVGQEAIVQTLGNAIQLNRVAHAYLFCGPRGTGKTSTARIFAKSLNCEQGPTTTPCLQCASCTGIAHGNALDVIEFDAASNNGVGDARELIENCQYSSMSGRFKVYIVDEVHMLTPQAFNALLKTLEEPPANVIFVFATTEAHKVLPTIVSRCQRFDFNRITTEDIVSRLQTVATAEQIEIDEEAVRMIARHARGGLRDAVGLLDQVAVLGRGQVDRRINRQDVALFIGTLEEDLLLRLSRAIAERQSSQLLADLNELSNRGVEPLQLLKDLSLHFRNLLVIQAAGLGVNAEALSLASDYCDALREQGVLFPDPEELPQILSRLASIERNVRHNAHPQLWLEVGLLELAYRHEMALVKTLSDRITQLEAQLASGGTVRTTTAVPSGPQQRMPAVAAHQAASIVAASPSPSISAAPAKVAPPPPITAYALPVEAPVPVAVASPTSLPAGASASPSSVFSTAALAPVTSVPVLPASHLAASISQDTPLANVSLAEYQQLCSVIPSLTLRSLLQQQAFPLSFVRDVLTLGVMSEPNLMVLKKPDRFIHIEKAAERVFGRPIRVDLQLEKNRPASMAAAPTTSPKPASVVAVTPPVTQSMAPPVTQTAAQPTIAPSVAPMAVPAAMPFSEEPRSSSSGARPPAMVAIAESKPIDFSAPPPPLEEASVQPEKQIPLVAPALPLWQDDDAPPLTDSQAPPPSIYDEDEDVSPPSGMLPRDTSTGNAAEVLPTKVNLPGDGDPVLREAQKQALDVLQGKVLD
jgi:DNA polymerase III subunit gamma/tau